MVEMSETSEILHTATSKSLVILDELGRGTSTFDGMAIADGVLRHLISSIQCKTRFITHFPLLATNIEREYPNEVENVHMGFETISHIDGTRDVVFKYRLTPGTASESFGIECARLAGLDEDLLAKASQRSSEMRKSVVQRVRRNM
jgi:DNA mismatch repair protein MSH3